MHHPSIRATASLLNSAMGKDIEMPGSALFAPVWVQKSEQIRVELSMLKDRLGKLKEMHSKMLLVSFDPDETAQTQVEALTRELQNGFKKLDKEIRGMEQTPGSDDAEVRQQVQRQLARALMGLTMEFRKEETRFLNKVRTRQVVVCYIKDLDWETSESASQVSLAIRHQPSLLLAPNPVAPVDPSRHTYSDLMRSWLGGR